ncbi:MAG: oligosaccharide flippase family protein [Slackia sp.]|nr:oligosaccharide flippase family protein [Slackia sp.]
MSATQQECPRELSLKANMLWNSIGSMFYLGCQWLITVLVVRLSTGFDAAGLLSLAMSVVGIFGTFANYKMGTYQISDIHRENTLAEYLAFRCVTLGLSFLACIVYAVATCLPHAVVTVALFFIYKGVGLLIDIMHGADQQHRRMDYIGKSFILQGIVSIGAFAVVFYPTQDLNAAIVAMTVGVLIVFAGFDMRKTRVFEPIGLHLTRKKAFFFLKTSLPAVIASVAASAIFTIPKQYLAQVGGDAALGIYSSVAAPALVVQMGATYLYGPLLDIFPKHFFDGKRKDFVKLLGRTIVSILAITALCWVVLIFVGEPVLVLLFGPAIEEHVYLLYPVLIATSATAFLWFFGDLLITLRDFRANFIGNVVAFVVVIPLSVICVNIWGMNGVSFAGTGACLAGVAYLACALVSNIRKNPGNTTSEEIRHG